VHLGELESTREDQHSSSCGTDAHNDDTNRNVVVGVTTLPVAVKDVDVVVGDCGIVDGDCKFAVVFRRVVVPVQTADDRSLIGDDSFSMDLAEPISVSCESNLQRRVGFVGPLSKLTRQLFVVGFVVPLASQQNPHLDAAVGRSDGRPEQPKVAVADPWLDDQQSILGVVDFVDQFVESIVRCCQDCEFIDRCRLRRMALIELATGSVVVVGVDLFAGLGPVACVVPARIVFEDRSELVGSLRRVDEYSPTAVFGTSCAGGLPVFGEYDARSSTTAYFGWW